MRNILLLLFRFSLAAWVGAAVFFVLTITDLRRSALFEEDAKLNHARVLLPLYYQCEFTTLGLCLASGLAARLVPPRKNTPPIVVLCMLAGILGLAAVDWFWVYQPLVEMISAPLRPAEFRTFHRISMGLNAGLLALCAIAAVRAIWPEK